MRKVLLSVAAFLTIAALGAYQNQTQILLALVKYQSANEYEVGPPRDIPWNTGPDEAVTSLAERPPNIILIVADDLGYNDISTFGGGLADGRVKTPHIDQLAADGVVFTQSYSGAGTCAPSRAML
ncbi:MAG: sulfatase-like hydrolase/transferase, partial [Pseudomonadota bacterium]|nr:sulfatase-like hydrolase/transferase [Pseudomonadota bacterium]